METRVSSATGQVVIGPDQPTVLIGERINPAGKKRLAESLAAGKLDVVIQEAAAQVEAGADIIDINVGAFGVDEVSLLPQAVQAVAAAVDVPVCLDSAKPEAIEAALKVCRGKPLINSVSGEEHSLSRVLPLVKQHGAAVIGLVQDDEGIPRDAERRVAAACKIVERAEAEGIAREDIIIDCMAFAIGADISSGPAVIEAISRISTELGVNVTLGASNISFGMPDRPLLTSAFVAMAITAGATCLIVDVARVRPVVLAVDLVLGRDQRASRYTEDYRRRRSG